MAIHWLWELWMKPTCVKFPYLFQYLWGHDCIKQLKVSKSYLERIGDQLNHKLPYDKKQIREILSRRIEDASEPVRMNAFAIICRMNNWKVQALEAFGLLQPGEYNTTEEDPFIDVWRFLYFNVNTSSITMRKEILKNFRILVTNLPKFVDQLKVFRFFDWVHCLCIWCFQPGSSYQRKIIALNLYKIIMERKDSVGWQPVEWYGIASALSHLVLNELSDVRDTALSILLENQRNIRHLHVAVRFFFTILPQGVLFNSSFTEISSHFKVFIYKNSVFQIIKF